MIKGIGTDIVEVARIEKSISKEHGFKELVFAEAEIAACTEKGMPTYAGKFAAKEALLKAIGTGWAGVIALHEIEVANDDKGKPFIILRGKTKAELKEFANDKIHVSISNTHIYATAVVIIERKND